MANGNYKTIMKDGLWDNNGVFSMLLGHVSLNGDDDQRDQWFRHGIGDSGGDGRFQLTSLSPSSATGLRRRCGFRSIS